MATWLVDPDGTTHQSTCAARSPKAIPYRTKIKAVEDMAEHLSKPDSQNSFGARHDGPARVRACPNCIDDLIEEATA